MTKTAGEVPALDVADLWKSYGAVAALRGASLSVYPGEVVGLLGDNGAGKSTLVRCVTGRTHADRGVVKVDGNEVHFRSAHSARAMGIEVVHQNLALVNTLDAAANLFLGRELIAGPRFLRPLGFLRSREMRAQTAKVMQDLHVNLRSPGAFVDDLSGGQRQGIAVGRAVAWGQRVVLMDEPAAALGVEQAHHVLDLVRRLAASGVGVVFISHNMQHVIEVCDRVVVLRQGATIGTADVGRVTAQDLVGFITGAMPMDAYS
jgi:ABC-type sugar transport system ATPase subunit